MNPNKALWEKGDFTKIAEAMRESGAELVSKIGIKKGDKVLDVGCGDGTTAIPAAKLGANVTGVDIAQNLVDAGNQRAAKENLSNVKFFQGDACDLSNVADQTADVTVSIFGVMFAPKPFEVAKSLVRVTKKGGRIVMGNWIPGDPTLVAQILKISAAYTPPPPEGFVSPMLWGVESNVIERFEAAGIPKENISFDRDTYMFIGPFPPREFLSRLKNFYGPTMNAFEAAAKQGKEHDLERELTAMVESQNKGDANTTRIPATFLRVTVKV